MYMSATTLSLLGHAGSASCQPDTQNNPANQNLVKTLDQRLEELKNCNKYKQATFSFTKGPNKVVQNTKAYQLVNKNRREESKSRLFSSDEIVALRQSIVDPTFAFAIKQVTATKWVITSINDDLTAGKMVNIAPIIDSLKHKGYIMDKFNGVPREGMLDVDDGFLNIFSRQYYEALELKSTIGLSSELNQVRQQELDIDIQLSPLVATPLPEVDYIEVKQPVIAENIIQPVETVIQTPPNNAEIQITPVAPQVILQPANLELPRPAVNYRKPYDYNLLPMEEIKSLETDVRNLNAVYNRFYFPDGALIDGFSPNKKHIRLAMNGFSKMLLIVLTCVIMFFAFTTQITIPSTKSVCNYQPIRTIIKHSIEKVVPRKFSCDNIDQMVDTLNSFEHFARWATLFTCKILMYLSPIGAFILSLYFKAPMVGSARKYLPIGPIQRTQKTVASIIDKTTLEPKLHLYQRCTVSSYNALIFEIVVIIENYIVVDQTYVDNAVAKLPHMSRVMRRAWLEKFYEPYGKITCQYTQHSGTETVDGIDYSVIISCKEASIMLAYNFADFVLARDDQGFYIPDIS